MAPIKFEENIREKLQERELQPSKEAWGKLSAKLDAQLPHKKNNTFLWLAVAASFVGILLVTTLFFNKKEGDNQWVEETPIKILNNEPKQNDTEVASETVLEEKKTNEATQVVPKISVSKRQVVAVSEKNTLSNLSTIEKASQKETQQKWKPERVIAVTESKKETTVAQKLETEEERFIKEKAEEVVIAVQQIQKENQAVTPGEIDALLAKAQRDIANNRILNSSTQKVDAAALLMDVETELEQSFRDRVFNMLGEGFIKVRSAVAERNN